jgi:glutaredoxin-dependent peroxiredoxin
MPNPQVGDVVSDFTLPRSLEAMLTLSECLTNGPVLLHFYVFDFGTIWTQELSQLRDKEEQVRAAGGQVIAVAVSSVFAQQAFARHLGVSFPLLSDWNRTVAPAYGVQYDVWRGHQGVAKRSVFVIDRQGIIRYRWVTDDALVLPDFDAAIGVLRQL